LDKDIINESTGFEKAYMRVKIFTRLQCGMGQNPNLHFCLSNKLTSTRSNIPCRQLKLVTNKSTWKN